MGDEDDRYSIADLTQRTGVGRRTIHHYVSQGLLPPAEGAGPGAYYLDEHLLRLRLVSLLQAAGLRTDTIRKALDGWSVEEMERLVGLAEGRSVADLDTLGGWLMGRHFESPEASQHYAHDLGSLQEQAATLLESSAQRAAEPVAFEALSMEMRDAEVSEVAEAGETEGPLGGQRMEEPAFELGAVLKRPTGRKKKRRMWQRGSRGRDAMSWSAPAAEESSEFAGESAGGPTTSTWHRHSLNEDVEIHFRAPQSPLGFKRLRRLFDAAREIFSSAARDSPRSKPSKSKKK